MKYISPAIAMCLFLTSCMERNNFGVNLEEKPKQEEKTYTESIAQPQKRNILIEEFTGASCNNCPSGLKKLLVIAEQDAAHTILVGIHVRNMKEVGGPIHGISKYDLTTDENTEMNKAIFTGMNSIPTAGIDRILNTDDPQFGLRSFGVSLWPKRIADRRVVATPVNMEVTSQYDDKTRSVIIKVKASYTQDVNAKQFLSLYITEDNIIDAQKDGDKIVTDYNFRHTLRDIVTGTTGDEFLADMPVKEAGRVYERTFVYNLDASWKAENCSVVAFVHNNSSDSKEILQAAETKLKE